MLTNHIYSIYMNKQDLALNHLKWLICLKINTNQTKPYYHMHLVNFLQVKLVSSPDVGVVILVIKMAILCHDYHDWCLIEFLVINNNTWNCMWIMNIVELNN